MTRIICLRFVINITAGGGEALHGCRYRAQQWLVPAHKSGNITVLWRFSFTSPAQRGALHLSTFTQRTCTASHTVTGQTHDYALTARWSAVAPSQRPIRWSASGGGEGGWMERGFLLEGGGDRGWRRIGGLVRVCVCVCMMGSLSQGRPEIPQGWTLLCSNSTRFPNYLRLPPSPALKTYYTHFTWSPSKENDWIQAWLDNISLPSLWRRLWRLLSMLCCTLEAVQWVSALLMSDSKFPWGVFIAGGGWAG